jgi:hypothetical protein
MMARGASIMLANSKSLTEDERNTLQRIAAWSPDLHQELWARARAAVDAHYKKDGSWEELKDAIGALADITGGGELDG